MCGRRLVSAVPLGESIFGEYPLTYEIVGDRAVDESRRPTTNYQVVSATLFLDARTAIVAGRAFDARDGATQPARCYRQRGVCATLGGRNPIGLQVAFSPADSPERDAGHRRDRRRREAGEAAAGRDRRTSSRCMRRWRRT